MAAQNLAGVGPVSADVVAQVGLPPGPPQNAVATASGGVITLSWTPPASGGAVSTYIVQAGTASGAANVFNGAVGAGTAVSGAVPPGTYFLRVLAQGAGGTSAPSNETSVSVGAACTTPSAPALSGSRSGNVVTIAWSTPPGGPVTGYTVVAGLRRGCEQRVQRQRRTDEHGVSVGGQRAVLHPCGGQCRLRLERGIERGAGHACP